MRTWIRLFTSNNCYDMEPGTGIEVEVAPYVATDLSLFAT